MAEHHLGCFEPSRAWLEKLTSNEVITPAQFERAAKVARVGSLDDNTQKPLILKRASDILSKWVGESEQNIARMFNEAIQQDAVLVLYEADSFLADRRDAQNSWEVTQVNELLTQMEVFEGVFVCTTNLMSKLDQASLRRFAFKVRFDPLKLEQRIAMFRQELVRLGGMSAAAYRQHIYGIKYFFVLCTRMGTPLHAICRLKMWFVRPQRV